MPGPKKAFKSSSQLRKRLKIDKRNAALSSRSDSDDDIKVTCFPRKKILVICNDPDATESSSDEEERVQPKRRVTELFIPADCPLSVTDSEEELEKDWPLARCCSLSQFSADCSPTVANAELLRPVCSKRTSSKKLPALKKGKGTLNGRKSSQFVGVRRRRQGKWAAEIRDSAKGIRRWLGTYDSAEAAARAYDMAAKKIRGPQFSTNLDSLFVNSLRSSTNSLDDGSVRENLDQDFLLGTPCSESMFEDDQDYNSLVNSPSSVLDNAPSDDSESPNFFAADKVCSDFFNDECPTDSGCSEEISPQENVLVDGQSFEHEAVLETSLTLGSGSSDPRMEGPPFLEAPPFYDTLAPIFDVENDGSGNQRPCLSDPACDEYFTSEDGLGDLPWDLDPEVLAWINIPEACVV